MRAKGCRWPHAKKGLGAEQPPERLDDDERACPLGQEFAAMLRERAGERLDAWISEAQASGIDELARFAAGLLADGAAVRAGLTFAWSNGHIKGHVHRLKLLKRQMCGRANLDLLRARVLRAN